LKAAKKYDYCSRNLHEEPERYRFSKTGDTAFLKSFLALRKQRIEEIDEILMTRGNVSGSLEDYPVVASLCQADEIFAEWLDPYSPFHNEEYLPEEPASDCREYRTKDMISLIISQLLEKQAGDPGKRMDMLIKKYEIFRRIQSVYDQNFTKLGDNANDMDLYALFSVALLLAYKKKGSLKSLNTALKVNDMLATRHFLSESLQTLILSRAAFAWECSLIKELASKHGFKA
jgi:hypothetical protein